MALLRGVHVVLLVSISGWTSAYNTEQFILRSDKLPVDDRFRPAIGNGHVATNVLSDTVYMNGVYNGVSGESHRARIPATSAIDVIGGNNVTRNYSLDMLTGIFTQTMITNNADITLQYFAHRKFSRLLVTILKVTRRRAGKITMNLKVNRGRASDDLNLLKMNKSEDYVEMHAMTMVPEVSGRERNHVFQFWTPVPSSVALADVDHDMVRIYVTSTSNNRNDAWNAFTHARTEADALVDSHVKAWMEVWDEGHLELSGTPEVARTINAGLYYILSSLPLEVDPVSPFMGLSPGGLSRGGIAFPNKTSPYNDYLGHVFWDMDTWILPPIMTLHPQLARIMIGARTRVLPAARAHAKETGFHGARFPWEQGQTGSEVSPWGPAAKYQVHVTADVSLALRQYLYLTDDASLLTNGKGLEMAMAIARFWKSRSEKTGDETYEITGVMGPDEYHVNVNNSVFTNYNAKLSLQLPAYIRDTYNVSMTASCKKEISEFSDIANKLVILFDKDKQFHPQYKNVGLNETIKQSDVVLLGYPLMMPMSTKVRRNDLEIYENLTDRFGPDTGTWSMHTVTRLELGDVEQAADDFRMMFRNVNGPFKVFSEKPYSNAEGIRCVNFITGAGGLLQSVIFGYAGVRMYSGHLGIRPRLLPNRTEWAIRGLHYRGMKLDLEFSAVKLTLTIVEGESGKYIHMSDENESNHRHVKIGGHVERPLLGKYRLSVKKVKTRKTTVHTSNVGAPKGHKLLLSGIVAIVLYLYSLM